MPSNKRYITHVAQVVIIYFGFVILSLVLMLNLLIAQVGTRQRA